jgi:hypothetical protein
LVSELVPQYGERSSEEARDGHLGDPEPFGDLGLHYLFPVDSQMAGDLGGRGARPNR